MPYGTMGMGDSMGAGGSTPAATAPPPAEETKPGTLFISKETLGGKTVKKGDTLTLTVADVDPETGDAEATIAVGADGAEGGGEGSNEAAFDKAMPPETEGMM